MMARTAIPGSLLLAILATVAGAQQQHVMTARERVAIANESLAAGNFARAEAWYADALDNAGALGALAAGAYFGYALAIQQGSGDSISSERLGLVLGAYENAWRRDRSLRVPGASNIALAYRSLGDHALAARWFANAGESARDTQRVARWMEAAAEYELADSAVRASELYERVVGAQRGNERAIEGMVRTASLHSSAGEVLGWAERWVNDTTVAAAVADGMLTLLTREGDVPRGPAARRALGHVAVALTNARMGPSEFAARIRPRLEALGSAGGDASPGAWALADAYASRPADGRYVEPPTAAWWHEVSRERAAWSGMMRWLGDWHNQRGSSALARSFYEAAVGRGGEHLMREWADTKALVPLALLYAQDEDASGSRLEQNVGQYTEMLFMGKAAAYQRNDLDAIRTFHTALGSFYASRGQWTGPGARNAEFQLSRMREVTRQLNRQGRRLSDSPELLARLAAHYERTGRSAQADTLRREVRTHFEIRKRPAAADSLLIRIRRPTPP